MLPCAHVVHQLRGRVRIRILEKRGDPEFFQEARRRLDTLPGVADVWVNANTGSILLLHPEQSYEELEPHIRRLELFEIVGGSEPERPALATLESGIARINGAISSGTHGSADLRTLIFVGLMALTIRQVIRGQIMAPALPLLGLALNLLHRGDGSEGGSSDSDP